MRESDKTLALDVKVLLQRAMLDAKETKLRETETTTTHDNDEEDRKSHESLLPDYPTEMKRLCLLICY